MFIFLTIIGYQRNKNCMQLVWSIIKGTGMYCSQKI